VDKLNYADKPKSYPETIRTPYLASSNFIFFLNT